MSSASGNHLGLSKVQRMLPLQRLNGKQEDESVGSCALDPPGPVGAGMLLCDCR